MVIFHRFNFQITSKKYANILNLTDIFDWKINWTVICTFLLSKVHKCLVCQKEFARANHLKRHQTSHSSIKPFRCASCPKSFNRRDHLNQHEKLHQRSNDYECDLCQKPFNRADHLAKHKASKHGIGEKICVSNLIVSYENSAIKKCLP